MGTIVFVGAGSMAEAIIAGILKNEVIAADEVYVMNNSDDERLSYMQKSYGVSIVCQERKALRNAELIVLATKPKDIKQAMRDIGMFLNNDAAVLSVIAGVSIETIENGLGNRPIARAMPNTSATIGKSASGVSMNASVVPSMKERILNLLLSIGVVKEVEEDELHTVTALSGSGPAYVYYMVEAIGRSGHFERAIRRSRPGADHSDARWRLSHVKTNWRRAGTVETEGDKSGRNDRSRSEGT